MEQYKYYGRNQGMQNRNTSCYDNRRNQNAYMSQDPCGCDSNRGMKNNACDCDYSALQKVEDSYKEEKCCTEKPIGMAYVPMQKWEKLYDPENALFQGTAFPSLNLIFCGVRGKM